MRAKSSTNRKTRGRRQEPRAPVTIPEGVPPDARIQPYDMQDDRPPLGVHAGDVLVTWKDAPALNFDLVFVVTEDHACLGRFYSTARGRVRVFHDGGYCVFKPSDVLRVDRVMHIERAGEVVKRYPLKDDSGLIFDERFADVVM